MLDMRTALVVGTAVATPTLLKMGARAGVPINAYVTAAQRAAMAELGRTIAGVAVGGSAKTMQAQHRWNELQKGGAFATVDGCTQVVTAFLAAAHAGAFVSTDNVFTETYRPTDDWLALNVMGDFRQVAWDALATGDAKPNSLGNAIATVMGNQRGLASGFLSESQDLDGVRYAVGILAVEMDNQGYLITGKPEDKTIAGGLGAAADAVADFGGKLAAGALKDAVVALWTGLNALPLGVLGALAIGGYIVVRHEL